MHQREIGLKFTRNVLVNVASRTVLKVGQLKKFTLLNINKFF
jgi:hypothetical protein